MSEDNKEKPIIDQVLEGLIDGKRHGDGWALNLTKKDGDHTFSVVDAPPITDDFIPPSDVRKHMIEDVESFILYAKKYGDSDKSLIFYNNCGVGIVLVEVIDEGDREYATMDFESTEEYSSWDDFQSGPVGHKRLLNHMVRNSHTLEDPGILVALRDASFRSSITSASVRDDSKNEVGLVVKTEAGDGLVKFPKSIRASIPILPEDLPNPDAWVTVEFKLMILLPERPGDSITFELMCPEWSMIKRQRVGQAADVIKAELGEAWTIVRGRHNVVERRFGKSARR